MAVTFLFKSLYITNSTHRSIKCIENTLKAVAYMNLVLIEILEKLAVECRMSNRVVYCFPWCDELKNTFGQFRLRYSGTGHSNTMLHAYLLIHRTCVWREIVYKTGSLSFGEVNKLLKTSLDFLLLALTQASSYVFVVLEAVLLDGSHYSGHTLPVTARQQSQTVWRCKTAQIENNIYHPLV